MMNVVTTVLSSHLTTSDASCTPSKALTWVVADLTGPQLKRLGGHGELSTIIPYRLPQMWSQKMHEHPAGIDGFFYMSRHCNSERAVVLFERAKGKLNAVKHVRLIDHPSCQSVIKAFSVRFTRQARPLPQGPD